MSKKSNKLPSKNAEYISNFKPKTEKQEEFINLINSKEVIVAIGVPGSGKTFTALASSLALLGDYYKKIILIKSVTTLPGEAIGFIPGNVEQKMDPFIMSYTWNIDKILGYNSAKSLMDRKLVEVLPLAYIRGLSIDNSIVIIDESQNFDAHTFKTIITRIGSHSKYIFLGDIEQVDMKNRSASCLKTIVDIFSDSNIIGTIKFEDSDCVRNPIIPEILEKLRENNI
jgi:phosphate starvation-inducible PhoH-like protein